MRIILSEHIPCTGSYLKWSLRFGWTQSSSKWRQLISSPNGWDSRDLISNKGPYIWGCSFKFFIGRGIDIFYEGNAMYESVHTYFSSRKRKLMFYLWLNSLFILSCSRKSSRIPSWILYKGTDGLSLTSWHCISKECIYKSDMLFGHMFTHDRGGSWGIDDSFSLESDKTPPEKYHTPLSFGILMVNINIRTYTVEIMWVQFINTARIDRSTHRKRKFSMWLIQRSFECKDPNFSFLSMQYSTNNSTFLPCSESFSLRVEEFSSPCYIVGKFLSNGNIYSDRMILAVIDRKNWDTGFWENIWCIQCSLHLDFMSLRLPCTFDWNC